MMKIVLTLSVLMCTLLSFAQQCPCCDSTHQQFNFWVGKWNVYNQAGKLLGTNTITSKEDNCVISEHWVSAQGKVTGTSNNYYDRNDKKWHQHWIDNTGGVLNLSGGLVDGSMIMLSDIATGKDGKTRINRIKWTPDKAGNVRQLWETSADGGQTWTVLFDGLYKKE